MIKVIGQCGIPCLWTSRRSLLHLCYLFTFFSTFCTIFGIISIRSDEASSVIGSWTSGSGTLGGTVAANLWVGLSGSVWETPTGTSYILWEDIACTTDKNIDDTAYCSNCNSGGNTAAGLVLLAVITRIPSIVLLKARMENSKDLPLIKILGILSEGLAALAQAGALFVWREYCHKNLPNQTELNLTAGTGFILVALGLAITVCLGAVHSAIPTLNPEDRDSVFSCGCCNSETTKQKPIRTATTKPARGGGYEAQYRDVCEEEGGGRESKHTETRPQKPIDRDPNRSNDRNRDKERDKGERDKDKDKERRKERREKKEKDKGTGDVNGNQVELHEKEKRKKKRHEAEERV